MRPPVVETCMKCQKCQIREAVTFGLEIDAGRANTILVCRDCFLPLKEDASSRMTSEGQRALVRASREMTDPASAARIRPALLYYLLENESSILHEAVVAAGIHPASVREELASFLSGEKPEGADWASTRGITPALAGARKVAQRLEHETIGVEHLFLGLVETPEPGDPWLMIQLASRAADVERILHEMMAPVP